MVDRAARRGLLASTSSTTSSAGRLENRRAPKGRREPRRRGARHPRACRGRQTFSARATFSTSRASGDIVPSIDKPWTIMSTECDGNRASARMRAGTQSSQAGVCRVVVVLRPRRRADARRRRRSAPSIPTRLSKYGRGGRLCTGESLQAAGEFDPHLQRLRHTLKDFGAYGAVFGVFLAQKLAG